MTDPIPNFEGHPVSKTAVKITGKQITEDLVDQVLYTDDTVQVLSHFRVVGVHHNVDEGTGEITRVQILRPVEMMLCPVDPDDPNDTGIIRSLRGSAPLAIGGGGE